MEKVVCFSYRAAALVEQTAAASKALDDKARVLFELVDFFKLAG